VSTRRFLRHCRSSCSETGRSRWTDAQCCAPSHRSQPPKAVLTPARQQRSCRRDRQGQRQRSLQIPPASGERSGQRASSFPPLSEMGDPLLRSQVQAAYIAPSLTKLNTPQFILFRKNCSLNCSLVRPCISSPTASPRDRLPKLQPEFLRAPISARVAPQVR
jgi:hypothetical protein